LRDNCKMPARNTLQKIVAQLAKHHGAPDPPITTDPFELILIENVAYLVSDERRAEALKTLRKVAGTKPHQILAASRAALARHGKELCKTNKPSCEQCPIREPAPILQV